ncbi:MAG: hypothetical protein V4714_14070 [Bacteroidota bacterium]
MTRLPMCIDCQHFADKSATGLVCKAFPKGIPDAILFDENDHSKVYPGQDGEYVFMLKDKISKSKK